MNPMGVNFPSTKRTSSVLLRQDLSCLVRGKASGVLWNSIYNLSKLINFLFFCCRWNGKAAVIKIDDLSYEFYLSIIWVDVVRIRWPHHCSGVHRDPRRKFERFGGVSCRSLLKASVVNVWDKVICWSRCTSPVVPSWISGAVGKNRLYTALYKAWKSGTTYDYS